jgi:cytidine deaminase
MVDNKDLSPQIDLVALATSTRAKAYAPYSNFCVGAALLTKRGKVFVGCNIENVSLGLTICAERSAVAAAISAGCKDIEVIAIVANSRNPPVPCGACRQVLAEFNPTMTIVAATTNGEIERFNLADLLPKPVQGILDSNV